MKKIFSLFAAVIFAGSIFAADAKVVLDLTNSDWGFPSAYDKEKREYTHGGYTITIGAPDGHKKMTSGDTQTGIILGKNGATLTLPEFDFAVSQIVVTGISGASGKVTTNIYVGDDAVSTEIKGSTGVNTFEIAADNQAAGNIYVFKVTNANNAQISKIEIFEKVAGAPDKPTFTVEEGVYLEAQSVELKCATDGAEIHYTLDGSDPTAESELYAEEALNIEETTTIKAVAIKDGVSSDVVALTITIVEVEGAGTKDDPFTVADVVTLNNGFAGKHWVVGYIVGCAANEGAISDKDPEASNIALGDAANQTENVVPVQLTKDTDARAALNIVDNPGNVGKKVKVHGELVSYFLFKGVKNIDDYEIINTDPTAIDNVAGEVKAQKVIRDGQLYIVKDGVLFNANGVAVK